MYADRFAHPGVSPRLSETLTSERLASGPDGIKGVGLGAVLGGFAFGPVEFDDPFAATLNEDAETASIAGGALDDPRPLRRHAGRVGPEHSVAIAVIRRREPFGGQDSRCSCFDRGDGDPVSIGVDADDMVDEFCKHDDGTSWRVFRSVPAWNRYVMTVMGHTSQGWTGF